MKLKIWEDERGFKHASLDNIEITSILTGIDLSMCVGYSSDAVLKLLPSSVDVEVDVKVGILIDGTKYRLESIRKEQ